MNIPAPTQTILKPPSFAVSVVVSVVFEPVEPEPVEPEPVEPVDLVQSAEMCSLSSSRKVLDVPDFKRHC